VKVQPEKLHPLDFVPSPYDIGSAQSLLDAAAKHGGERGGVAAMAATPWKRRLFTRRRLVLPAGKKAFVATMRESDE
jgi:hypothetical protein